MNSEQLTKETIEIIQKNVRIRRSELDLTQEDLAKRMDTQRQSVVKIENYSNGITSQHYLNLQLHLRQQLKT